ncbi:MAG TPA: ECF-type sigma factor [Verrucomicrobiae bacterium]
MCLRPSRMLLFSACPLGMKSCCAKSRLCFERTGVPTTSWTSHPPTNDPARVPWRALVKNPVTTLAVTSLLETAPILGISVSTAKKHWAFSRAWLLNEIKSN